MSKILYVVDQQDNKEYHYSIKEDTIIYHFSINSSSKVVIDLDREGVSLYYYYNHINYDKNVLDIEVNHHKSNTHSELFNHGVNVWDNPLDYIVNGIVPKKSKKCICNQENQIINLRNGKSSIHPNLLIDNYDVESNHSAYIGKWKEEKLFYLMSRGISRKEAYRLLLNAFLFNIDSIDMSQVKEFQEEIKKI